MLTSALSQLLLAVALQPIDRPGRALVISLVVAIASGAIIFVGLMP